MTHAHEFGASGSKSTTVGIITPGSRYLALQHAIDFADGHGVLIHRAGPACGLSAPSTPSLSVVGPSVRTYTYCVVAITRRGGCSPAGPSVEVSAAEQLGGKLGWVDVAWQSVPGADGYLIYRDGELRTMVADLWMGAHTWTDLGQPACVGELFPASPPAIALPEHLLTTIASGGGGTSLVIADVAASAVSGLIVQHDDSAALQQALSHAAATDRELVIAAGNYSLVEHIGLVDASGVRVRGVGAGRTVLSDLGVSHAPDLSGLLSFVRCAGVDVEALTIRGNRGAGSAATGKAVYGDASELDIERVEAMWTSGEALYAQGDSRLRVERSKVHGCLSNALNLNSSDTAGRAWLFDNEMTDNWGSAVLAGGLTVECAGNLIRNPVPYGVDLIVVSAATDFDVSRNVIVDSDISSAGASGILVGFAVGQGNFNVRGTVQGNRLVNNAMAVDGGASHCAAITLRNARGPVFVTGNVLHNNGRDIGAGRCRAILVTGPEAGQATIADNNITAGDYPTVAVTIDADVTGLVTVGETFGDLDAADLLDDKRAA